MSRGPVFVPPVQAPYPLHSVDVRIGNKQLLIRCAENVVPAAKMLFTQMIDRAQQGRLLLRDGMVEVVGWSQLVFRVEHDALVAHEPNYAGNPLISLRPDATTTLAVWTDMMAVAHANNQTPEPPRFSTRVIVSPGWAHAAELLLSRTEDEARVESGWSISDGHEAPRLPLRVYELLGVRPTVLSALALPRGTRVSFDRDMLRPLQ